MVEVKEGSKEPEGTGAKRQPPRSGPAEETEQLVFTQTSGKGEILKVERVDKSGQRLELREKDFAALAEEQDLDQLDAALEEAYGAGFMDALGEEDEDEDEEETALRRLVLARLLGRRMVRRGLRNLVLRRALRHQLIERAGQGRGKALDRAA